MLHVVRKQVLLHCIEQFRPSFDLMIDKREGPVSNGETVHRVDHIEQIGFSLIDQALIGGDDGGFVVDHAVVVGIVLDKEVT